MKRLLPALILLLPLAGCSGGDPEPVVGDNPASANGKSGPDALTPEQKSKRQNAAQPPSGPG